MTLTPCPCYTLLRPAQPHAYTESTTHDHLPIPNPQIVHMHRYDKDTGLTYGPNFKKPHTLIPKPQAPTVSPKAFVISWLWTMANLAMRF